MIGDGAVGRHDPRFHRVGNTLERLPAPRLKAEIGTHADQRAHEAAGHDRARFSKPAQAAGDRHRQSGHVACGGIDVTRVNADSDGRSAVGQPGEKC